MGGQQGPRTFHELFDLMEVPLHVTGSFGRIALMMVFKIALWIPGVLGS